MEGDRKGERTGAAEAVLARQRHKMASFIFAGLGIFLRTKKNTSEMKARSVEEDAGVHHRSPVSRTPPERMTMERMPVGCVSARVGGSFIARRFTSEPMALGRSDVPKMSRYAAGV